MRFPRNVALTCIALTLLTPHASSGAEAAKKNASPADAIAAAEQAYDRNDSAGRIDCLSTAGQTELIGMLVVVTEMAAAADPAAKDAQKQIDALFAKHGVTDRAPRQGEHAETRVKRITSQIKDRRAFLIDALKLNSAADPPGSKCIKGQLKDVKITGDTATGTYVTRTDDSSSMSQEVQFSRADGSWLIDSLLGLTPAPQAAKP